MESNTKLRLLYIYQQLVQDTDKDHTLSIVQLTKILKEKYGLTVSRNTMTNDLEMLHEGGLHIEHYKSTQNRYYYDGQLYDQTELKILVDAIASSRSITQMKSDALIEKLLTLTTERNAKKLRRHIYPTDRVKTDNEDGYYILDAINSAIDSKRKISFRYIDFDVRKQRTYRNDGKPYTVSPYALIWDGDYYYVRGYCDEREAMRNFRLDRIDVEPDVLDEMAVEAPEDSMPEDYEKCVFRMMDTDKPRIVHLQCEASMMKHIIDNFGLDVRTRVVDKEHFHVAVKVCTSPTFYRWVFGYDGKIKITSPRSVVEEYKAMLQRAMENAR